jgi:5-methyltetrahydropteroyltriglutamate--homocysteine methyltransferase
VEDELQRSAERILTTHVGSLPRPPDLVALLLKDDRGEALDPAALEQRITRAVADIVARQAELGIDIVSDGEAGKVSYSTYIQQRLSGYGPEDPSAPRSDTRRDVLEFPEYYERMAKQTGPFPYRRLVCVGPVAVKDRAPLQRDVANLRAAVDKVKVTGAFMTAASPGVIARFQPNKFYPSTDAYREALGEAMREEFEAIVKAGFLLQIDCPDLASGRTTVLKDMSDKEFLDYSAVSIEILNHALRNVPADSCRIHICWGNYEGPHIHDIDFAKILPNVLKAKPQVISFEAANPRHAHEWEIWRDTKLPDDKILMPGVLDTSTNYVEHPDLVAQRLCQFADSVGRERVIAATDCGFETFAGYDTLDRKIVFKKLESMVEGARIASKRLWR